MTLPAAFTVPTGKAHWSVLTRARAVEALAYVVAAAQWGDHDSGRKTYGHSMIVDPWGVIIAERDAGAGVIMADLDMMGSSTAASFSPQVPRPARDWALAFD